MSKDGLSFKGVDAEGKDVDEQTFFKKVNVSLKCWSEINLHHAYLCKRTKT